jgi:hypothetical protein
MAPDRQRGAATALVIHMLETAIRSQRDGGESLDLIVDIDERLARTLGLCGEGKLTLSLRPCISPAVLREQGGTN